MKKWFTIITSIVLVLVADLTTKHFLFEVDYFNLIPNVISVASNGGNTGGAFGSFSNHTMMLIIVSSLLIVALCIFHYFVKNKTVFYCLGFGFTIGGALGNLVDRVMLGYVRDWIFLDFFKTFPIFNLADTFLCIGIVIIAIHLLFSPQKKEG